MPRDDAATAAAKQDIIASLEHELDGPATRRPISLGDDVVARGTRQTDSRADLTAPVAASPERLPLGHAMPWGGTVVAGPPDDALEMARLEIVAALTGGPTPGAF